ncbi:MAG TPA: universal stress protein [Acidimicrobiales bacterium]|nr:universal stress protein [Acidimicrobiales bacterium]
MYRTIVVGTDGSKTATLAVARAADLAACAGAKLVVVSAYRPAPGDEVTAQRTQAPDDVAWAVTPDAAAQLVLDGAKEVAERAGVGEVRTVAVDVAPEDALLDVAERLHADAIVVGSQGMAGARRFLLGSVPNRVAHHAVCDVLIVKTDAALDG